MNKLFRGYQADHNRRSFLKGTGALGLTLAAAGGARGQSASVVVINEDGSVSTNATLAANPNGLKACTIRICRLIPRDRSHRLYLSHGAATNSATAIPIALSGAPAG